MIIRLAETNDLKVLCQLYIAFHEFHVRGIPARLLSLGDPGTYDCTDLFKTLNELLVDPNVAIFVADVDGRVVGLAEVHLRHDESSSAKVAYPYGYLQSLMVEAAFRRRGVGRQLVAAAEQWAKGRGAAEMRLETWEFAAGPLSFYESIGYATLRRTLSRSLVT